jgi:hypothetical protein
MKQVKISEVGHHPRPISEIRGAAQETRRPAAPSATRHPRTGLPPHYNGFFGDQQYPAVVSAGSWAMFAGKEPKVQKPTDKYILCSLIPPLHSRKEHCSLVGEYHIRKTTHMHRTIMNRLRDSENGAALPSWGFFSESTGRRQSILRVAGLTECWIDDFISLCAQDTLGMAREVRNWWLNRTKCPALGPLTCVNNFPGQF